VETSVKTSEPAPRATALLLALVAMAVLFLAGCPAQRAGARSVLDPTMLDRA